MALASTLTLYFTITYLMTSPRVAGLPSLPELDKSIAVRVNESAKTGALGIVALMRGPAAEPQTGLGALSVAGVAEARAGNASSDSVSNGREREALSLGGAA